MRKEDELQHKMSDLLKETQAGRLVWDLQLKTTEYSDAAEKQTQEIDGETWTVDECFVSYHCLYRGGEFLMITYERICTNGPKSHSTNLIFLPPLGIRVFDLDRLAPYAVSANQLLTYSVHMLWLALLAEYKKNPEHVTLSVTRGGLYSDASSLSISS